MIIQCDACRTRFRIADEKVTEAGVRVRCARCGDVFQVFRPEAEAPAPLPDAPEPPPPPAPTWTPDVAGDDASAFGATDAGLDFGNVDLAADDDDAADAGPSWEDALSAQDLFGALPDPLPGPDAEAPGDDHTGAPAFPDDDPFAGFAALHPPLGGGPGDAALPDWDEGLAGPALSGSLALDAAADDPAPVDLHAPPRFDAPRLEPAPPPPPAPRLETVPLAAEPGEPVVRVPAGASARPARREGGTLLVLTNALFAVTLGLALLVAFVAYRTGGPLTTGLLSPARIAQAFRSPSSGIAVPVLERRLYPLAGGGRALVVRGEVENRSDAPATARAVSVRLRGRSGATVAVTEGVLTGPPPADALHAVTGPDALRRLLGRGERVSVPARGRQPFTAVFLDPPPSLAGSRFEVTLVSGE